MKILPNKWFGLVLAVVIVVAAVKGIEAAPAKKVKRKKPFIIDYQRHLNKKFKKVSRLSTRYIIVHTSEAGLSSTLRTLSGGKHVGRYRTIGGHTNYCLARDGQVYRILHHRYRADHAGLSMWNGLEDISSHSLGIELVGYHYGTITPYQYQSLSRLLEILQRLYRIPDKNVLAHSQVSYGKPNSWFKRPHRGRKRCALNFEREKAGLKDAWDVDPDVKAGRLARDRHIYAMFYQHAKQKKIMAAASSEKEEEPGIMETTSPEKIPAVKNLTNVISRYNTAWNIAGEDFDDTTTLYILPGNRAIRGDQIGKRIGWNRIPEGTRVLLNQPLDLEKKKGPILLVTNDYTAWSFAGPDYSRASTFYLLPGGRLTPGNRISDWDSLPDGTRMIIGYNGPFTIQNVKGKTPWGIAGKAHNHPETVYFIPRKGLLTGDQISDFTDLPRGSKLFLKMRN
ncbi:MAG: N-acetylmuramoyl-L-alanine amidase [Candidatus Aminicenantes bacterium]|nr:MAG: N-acetylmuramoyl-L-alanine amidase [Candidatus Aminicenantes bacterium]